MKPLGGYRTCL